MKNYPKIGIRPVIDGRRRGVRESLEQKTMGMAESVAKFYSENLRYSDGTPVQCVIADTTIGGVAEANGNIVYPKLREIAQQEGRLPHTQSIAVIFNRGAVFIIEYIVKVAGCYL